MAVENLQPGAIFGRDFRVVRPLRAGGMGAVYIVEQISTGRQRALKILAPELAMDPGVRERFVLEARAASCIESDHVVEVVTAGVDEQTGSPFLVMELLKGEELADAAQRLGPLPLGDVAEILAQLGHALEQAHAQGIVHRDLKPENVFLAASRRRDAAFTAKILDFGIAKLVEEGSQKTGTQPLGTPLYMSPEQTDRRGRITPATDVWALGLIAFRLLTGRELWRSVNGTLAMLMREILVEPLPAASERARELGVEALLPPGFDAWFARCVSRDIDARFPEAGEAVRAFMALVGPDAARGRLAISGGLDQPSMVSVPLAAAVARLEADEVANAATVAVGDEAAATGSATAQSGAAASNPSMSTGGGSMSISGPPASPGEPAPTGPVASGGPATPKRGPLALVAAGALIALGLAAFAALKGGGDPSGGAPQGDAAPPTAAPTASAAAATPAGGTRCPEGMVLIRGGTAFLGSDDAKVNEAAPTHEVTLSSYCLDRTEVTVAAYQKCFEDQACPRPLVDVDWPKITDKQRKTFGPFCNAREPEARAQHPMNCVSWFMAETYCRKTGKRLPTEAEWEYAARGSDQRIYPWGDDPPGAKHLNACGKECAAWSKKQKQGLGAMYDVDDGHVGTAPVGSFPAGASAAGVLDLAGNVWEWVSDWYAPYSAAPQVDPKGPDALHEYKVIRGGDFLGQDPSWAKPAYRFRREPTAYNHAIGFRCAADPT